MCDGKTASDDHAMSLRVWWVVRKRAAGRPRILRPGAEIFSVLSGAGDARVSQFVNSHRKFYTIRWSANPWPVRPKTTAYRYAGAYLANWVPDTGAFGARELSISSSRN